MTKTDSIYEDLGRALARLKEALLLPSDNTINQDATIQRFEFTFELSWKLMQAVLINNRFDTSRGVKTIIREAADLEIISDPEIWFKFLDDRNLTAHTYKEDEARSVYVRIKDFPELVEELIEKAKDSL